jgi:hypothetical protein
MNKDKLKNILTGKKRYELIPIARNLGVSGYSKRRNIEIIECILEDCALRDVRKVLNIGIWNRYKEILIGTIIAIIIAVVVGGFYYTRSASKPDQVAMQSSIDEVQTQQDKLSDSQAELHEGQTEIINQMARLDKGNKEEFLKKYTEGYCIFTATRKEMIIPYKSRLNDWIINWDKAKVKNFQKDWLEVTLPTIVHKNRGSIADSIGSMHNRVVGDERKSGLCLLGIRAISKILSIEKDYIIFVVGYIKC